MTAEAAVRRVQRMARERFGDKLPSVDDFLAYKREQAALRGAQAAAADRRGGRRRR